jgi:hypothetical protein
MKWFVFALAFLNLVFFLWHFRTPPEPQMKPAQQDNSLKLVLLKEYQDEKERTVRHPSSTQEQPHQRCYTLGPFSTKKQVAQARDQLSDWGIKSQQRVNKDKSRTGFWVMIPPSDSRDQARDHIARLKANNIKDYFLVATGQYKNAVSLGVFSKPDLARRRLEAMTDLGFDARLEKVELPQREYWLDWLQAPDAKLAPDRLARLREQYDGIGQTQRSCQVGD